MKENIQNTNPFTAPENYFDNFSSEMIIKISEENIKEIAGTKSPFKVPENYFENSEQEINQKIERLIKIKKNPIYAIKPYLAIAASLIVVFMLWQIMLNNIKTPKKVNNNTIETVKTEQNENTATTKIYEEQIISIDEMSVLEIVEPQPTVAENKPLSEETLNYLAENIEYSDLLAIY